MRFAILDLYTDEPSGLGVPPYIGTYPRYIAGAVLNSGNNAEYITIDDLRVFVKGRKEDEIKTNIKVKNITQKNPSEILEKSDYLIVISGVHTPGKYLSALPGTVKECVGLLENIGKVPFSILTGPEAHCESGLYGGKVAGTKHLFEFFDTVIKDLEYKFDVLLEQGFNSDISASDNNYFSIQKNIVRGAEIVRQHPCFGKNIMAEIETSRGCPREKGCSFCTEPLKHCGIEKRKSEDIIAEISALNSLGVTNFRLGKQTCFYSYGDAAEIERLLKAARKYASVLHIDNVNPAMVTEEKTKVIVENCTPGNIAAFGIESFDGEVQKKNNLNSTSEQLYEAVKILNKYGAKRGENGMHMFLPGINLLFGLIGENKKTHEANMEWLRKILDEGLLLRRINIREVVAFPGTMIYEECGDKYIKKNRKYYWKWRNEIRQNIDNVMLKRLVPVDTVIRDVYTEVHDGNTTFGRQSGTYPLVVGIKERLVLGEYVDVKVKGHMLRSIVGEVNREDCASKSHLA